MRACLGIVALGILAATACGGGASTPASPPIAAPATTPAAASLGDPGSPMVHLLPEKVGDWTRTAAPQRYGPDDLWEYIDGGADQYLS